MILPFVQTIGIIWYNSSNYYGDDVKIAEIQEKIKPIKIYMMTKYIEYMINILYQIFQIKNFFSKE